MGEWIADANAWLAPGTLTILAIVPGIEKMIFLSRVMMFAARATGEFVDHHPSVTLL